LPPHERDAILGTGAYAPCRWVRILDEKEINEDIDRLVDLKADIIETISQVDDPTGQLLLEMRYINGKTWEEVAMDLGFDRRWVLRLTRWRFKIN